VSDPPLVVDDVSVDLGGRRVLSGVSLTAEAGALVGLIGPNGAGKTTLLRAIRNGIEVASGAITLTGQSVTGLSAREIGRRAATVPQETALSFGFSVREAVAMGRHAHIGRFEAPDATDQAAVESALDRTSLTELSDRPVTDLSGGERQRVLLARALAQATPVLLLDEPTASLDINHAIRTLETVRSVVDDGTAAVAAIHDLDLAARYCDRLVLLAEGEVVAAGPPSGVLTSDTLETAFDATAVVSRDDVTDAPRVTALPGVDEGEAGDIDG
jgi:iron complex transport system ATP-binding protein